MTNFDFLSPVQNLQINGANKYQLALLMLLATHNIYFETLSQCSADQHIAIDFPQLHHHQIIAIIRELCDLMEEQLLSQ